VRVLRVIAGAKEKAREREKERKREREAEVCPDIHCLNAVCCQACLDHLQPIPSCDCVIGVVTGG
jgi:hypothetical protein